RKECEPVPARVKVQVFQVRLQSMLQIVNRHEEWKFGLKRLRGRVAVNQVPQMAAGQWRARPANPPTRIQPSHRNFVAAERANSGTVSLHEDRPPNRRRSNVFVERMRRSRWLGVLHPLQPTAAKKPWHLGLALRS